MRIEVETKLEDFFRSLIFEVQQKRQLDLDYLPLLYLVQLFEKALQTDALFKDITSGKANEPLALMFGRAMEMADSQQKISALKQIGDRSLYISGFFSDSLSRQAVDIDYFMAMGGTAYSCVSSLQSKQSIGALFRELSIKFRVLVDLMAEVSEQIGLTSDKDLLRMYERWVHTKSDRLKQKLEEKGVVTCTNDSKILH